MGVKSTIRLTRAEAEERYIQQRLETTREEILQEVRKISDTHLEDVLEANNDAYFRREYGADSGFDNFLIVSEEQLSRDD